MPDEPQAIVVPKTYLGIFPTLVGMNRLGRHDEQSDKRVEVERVGF